MRVLLVMFLAGCFQSGAPGDSSGWIFPGGSSQGRCQSDSVCSGGKVCARSGACVPASQIYPVQVTWTLSGMPASSSTCNATPDLEIGFAMDSGAVDLEFLPVPCSEGKFSVDKLPTSYTRVRLGRANDAPSWQSATIDKMTGDATLDLMY